MIKIGLLLSLFIISCNKEDSANSDPFFGKWEIIEAEGFAASVNVGTVYDFREDGSVTLKGGGLTTNGTFVKTTADLTITISGIDLQYSYILNGNRLNLENKTADQNFVLEKK